MAKIPKIINDLLPLTEDCVHYQDRQSLPDNIQKYWPQRYNIFSRYDEGVYLTNDAWFGVTPEPIANRIATDMLSYPPSKTTIVDCFGGIGGNSIAFALSRRWTHVISIERDPATLACAQRNAALYGVRDRITFVLGDSFAVLALAATRPQKLPKLLRISPCDTVIFASPPWGGPGYVDDDVFDLLGMQPYGLADLTAAYRRFDHALFLPRTSDVRQIAAVVPGDEKADVIQYCIHGASKAMVAYIPAATETDSGAGSGV